MSRREVDFERRARVSAEHGRLHVICRVRRWSQLPDLNRGPAVYETGPGDESSIIQAVSEFRPSKELRALVSNRAGRSRNFLLDASARAADCALASYLESLATSLAQVA